MKTRVTLDVSDFTRFVVAHYYGGYRSRATRAEMKRFAAAAVETMARDWMLTLKARQYKTAQRLLDAPRQVATPVVETLDDVPRTPKLF